MGDVAVRYFHSSLCQLQFIVGQAIGRCKVQRREAISRDCARRTLPSGKELLRACFESCMELTARNCLTWSSCRIRAAMRLHAILSRYFEPGIHN